VQADVQVGGVEPFLAEWEALYAADPAATPFTSPWWARAWCRHWADGQDSWLVTVRDRGRLVGLAPLALRRRGPARVLFGLGTVVGNYWDVLAAPDSRNEVLGVVARALDDRSADWDVVVLDRLPQGSRTPSTLGHASLALRTRQPTPYLGMALPASLDAYLATVSAKARSAIRKRLRSVDNGEIALRQIDDPGELPTAVDTWQAMRSQWWSERGRSMNPEHASPRFRDFTIDAFQALVPAGRALVWEFTHEGEVVGIAFNFVDPRCFYHWLGAFDPGHQRLRLGQLVIALGIRSSIDAGRTYYDFMLGDESYKHAYGPVMRQAPSFVIGNRRLRSRTALEASGLGAGGAAAVAS